MRTFVAGVGMTKFEKAGARPDWKYPDIGKEAILDALRDSCLVPKDIEIVFASYCYGDSCCGQRVFREVALTSVPIINVNNNCSSGSTALYLARKYIESGGCCALAVGFEKMEKGLTEKYPHFPRPVEPLTQAHAELLQKTVPFSNLDSDKPTNVLDLFTSAGKEYMQNHNVPEQVLSLIAYKNHVHSQFNPKACFNKEIPLQEITNPKFKLTELLYAPMASPTADGGAATIIVSEQFLNKNKHLKTRAVEIIAQEMLSDSINYHQSFGNIVGADLAKEAARKVFDQSNCDINQVEVIELHDCFATNELLLYESLGLCKKGDAWKLITEQLEWMKTKGNGRLSRLGGRFYINPSGGLMSKGHPLGATGLAQCYELCRQLRGDADIDRQIIPKPKLGLQHNTGLGSSCVVTLYKAPHDPKTKL